LTELFTKEEMDKEIEKGGFSLFYLSRPECGVCSVLKNKIESVVKQIENLEMFYINLNNDESISGQYSIFTIPGILVYAQGKECLREARYISVSDIETRLKRISELLIN